ncbi:MAG: hypothetical protein ACRDOH_10490 [Streptosporangiaceae bacterium]
MTADLTHQGTQARTAEPATPAGRRRLREACHRIHLTIQEMNYGARRAVEVQAPWSVDKQWRRR